MCADDDEDDDEDDEEEARSRPLTSLAVLHGSKRGLPLFLAARLSRGL